MIMYAKRPLLHAAHGIDGFMGFTSAIIDRRIRQDQGAAGTHAAIGWAGRSKARSRAIAANDCKLLAVDQVMRPAWCSRSPRPLLSRMRAVGSSTSMPYRRRARDPLRYRGTGRRFVDTVGAQDRRPERRGRTGAPERGHPYRRSADPRRRPGAGTSRPGAENVAGIAAFGAAAAVARYDRDAEAVTCARSGTHWKQG